MSYDINFDVFRCQENNNYFYSLILNSYNTAKNEFDYTFDRNIFKNEFDNSYLTGNIKKFDRYCKIFGYDPNKQFSKNKWTPIMFAAWKQNGKFISHIISSYLIDLNIKNSSGLTVLHFVCMRRLHEYIRPLIKNGANVFIKDEFGYNPFDYLDTTLVNKQELVDFYFIEQKWLKRKYLFLIQKKINFINSTLPIYNVFFDQYLLRFISSFL